MALTTLATFVRHVVADGASDKPFDFFVGSAAEVRVRFITALDPDPDWLVNGADFTARLSVPGPGGAVAFTPALTGAGVIEIERNTALTQGRRFHNVKRFPNEAAEGGFDQAMAAVQELDELAGRAIVLPRGADIATHAGVAPAAGTMPRVNDAGDAIEWVDSTTQSAASIPLTQLGVFETLTAFVADKIDTAVAALRAGVDGALDTLAEIAAALALKAPLASPALTGNPTAPTPAPGDDDTSIATTGFVTAAIGVVLGGVASAYDTLAEIVAVLTGMGATTKTVVETGAAIALATDTPANIAFVDIPADGDYDVWGMLHFKGDAATTVGYVLCSISTSSAVLNLAAERVAAQYQYGFTPFAGVSLITMPLQEFRIAGATAGQRYYIVAQAGFGAGGLSGYGHVYLRRRKFI